MKKTNYYFKIDDKLVSKKAQSFVDRKKLESLSTFLQNTTFSNQKEYDVFLKELLSILRKTVKPSIKKQSIYLKEMKERNRKIPLIEPTPWGLVSLKKVDVAKDFIQKLLVIKQHGILGFEYHEKKLEKLRVLEGVSLILYANHATKGWKEGQISARIATTGDTFEFQPYDEHGMIALTNAVIEETSTNHLDDLLFIFTSAQKIMV